SFRLEQIYSPSIELANPLSVHLTMNRPATPGPNAQPAMTLKDAGTINNVARDLIDEPLRFDLDLSAIPDGRTVIRAEVEDGTKVLGTVALPIEVRRGLDQRIRQLQSVNN